MRAVGEGDWHPRKSFSELEGFLCLFPASEGGGRGTTPDGALCKVLGEAEGTGERDGAPSDGLEGSFPSSSPGGGDSADTVLRGLVETPQPAEVEGSSGETGGGDAMAVSPGLVRALAAFTFHFCARSWR